MNYEVEQKRHWRYWVWKRIAENCGVHPSFATVLFLSGPSPSDLQAAQKYGFKLRNIVAVDMNAECVEAARKAGCTAIQGSLHEVVTKWSDGTIHGVVADYCCGLTFNTAIESFQIASLANACAFNFQRGRECDAESRMLRTFFDCKDRGKLMKIFINVMWYIWAHWSEESPETFGTFVALYLEATAQYDSDSRMVDIIKHDRPKLFSTYFEHLCQTGLISVDEMERDLLNEIPQKWHSCSYRSNAVVMDTIAGDFRDLKNNRQAWYFERARKTPIDRRLAATKAIRTMNGAVKLHASQN
jgi:hypothetical protein